MQKSFTAGVIGGGLMGMSIALQLTRKGYKTTILESAPDLGGLASAWNYDDYVWDKFYHVILPDDTLTLGMIKELGLESELNWVETKTGFFINGQYHSMSDTLEFLKFPELNLIDKFRLGLTILAGTYYSNYESLEKISVTEWLKKWSGKKTFKKIWLPLLKAKLGEDYKYASAAFICATIKRLYGARKKGAKKEVFGYVNGGYARILESFKMKLLSEGVKIITEYKVDNIKKISLNEIEVTSINGNKEQFDYVISTLPSVLTAKISPELSATELKRLRNTKYLGVLCISLLLKNSLTPYYVTNITDSKIPFTGVIEMTSIVDKSFFGGNSLVYLPRYLSSNDPEFDLPDDILKEKYISSLKRMQPCMKEDEILVKKAARVKFMITLPEMSYSRNLPSWKTSLKNLFIINSSFITDGTLNVNETLKIANKYLPEVLTFISNESTGNE